MGRVPKVVILGGGYVAIKAVAALRSAVKRAEIELVVVDQNNYHTFHGLVPDMLVGKIQAGQIISPSRRLFAPARFIAASVDEVDLESKSVRLSRIIDGQPHEFSFDYLLVNLGSVDDLTRYRGVGEHTLRLKTYWDIITVRNHLLAMLEMAELEDDPEERKRILHFVVAGGNYAGIEVAAALTGFARDLTRREFRHLGRDEITISVVHSGAQILPELGAQFPKLAAKATRVLEKRGVKLELGVRLSSATPVEAVLDDGRRLPTRTIISCTGCAQSPVLETLPFDRDPHGRLVTDAYCRVDEQHQVWSGGDCAAVPMKNGGVAPPLALYAMEAGKLIGRNILRSIRGQRLKTYSFNGFGDCCVLGSGKAVGQVWGVPLSGLIASAMWHACMVMYLPSWLKRVRTVLDWTTTPLFGRDITSVNAGENVGVQKELFEPGQVIVREGDIGRAMFFIKSGTVEVVCGAEGREEHLAELGSGEHFGEIAVLKDVRRTATVRAKDQVELLRISRDETRLLMDQKAYQGFGEVETTAECRVPGLPS